MIGCLNISGTNLVWFTTFYLGLLQIFCDISQNKPNGKDEPNRSVTGRYASSKFRPKMASVTMSCVQKLFVGPGRFLSVMSDGPTRFGEQ